MALKNQELAVDIYYEILVGLPVNTLCRFCCVCKLWHNLISCRSFQDDHYRRQRQSPLLIAVENKSNKPSVSTFRISKEGFTLVNEFIIDKFSPYDAYEIQSCLGLVCIADILGPKIFICNPSTKDVIALPFSNGDNRNIGFGYAPSTKEFKVVKFGYYPRDCQIFTLGTIDWRKAREPPFGINTIVEGNGAIFLHAATHFLHLEKDIYYYISAFNLESEDYNQIRVPEDYDTDMDSWQLLESRGSLCLIGKLATSLDIWLLKEYNSENWVKEYNIDVSCAWKYNTYELVLANLEDGSICIVIPKRPLLRYNPQDKTVTEIIVDNHKSKGLYVESFRSLQSYKATRDIR